MNTLSKAPEGVYCRVCGSNTANISFDERPDWPSKEIRHVYECAPCYGERQAKSIFKALDKAADTDSGAKYLQALSSAIDDLQGLEVDLGGPGWVPVAAPYLTPAQIAMRKRLDSRSPYTGDDND